MRLRSGLVERFLRAAKPDILCLQEIKCMNDQFPAEAFARLGYEHQAVHGQKAYHGVSILSRLALRQIECFDYCGKGDARHVKAVFDAPCGPVGIHNFYVPAGGDIPDPDENEKFRHKLAFLDEMKSLKAKSGAIPHILAGDLNIAPLEDDVWSHKQLLKVVSHTPIETDSLTEILEKGGWVDAVRKFLNPPENVFSWWSYRSPDWDNADKGRRLDHIWCAPVLADKLRKAEIMREARGWEKPSDHVPVLARFDF